MQLKTKLQFGIFLTLMLTFNFSQAQVGIGTPSPDNSAMLEINSTSKGVLFPRIALKSSTDNTTVSSPTNGLIVWNNGQGGLAETGFYYWNNSRWNIVSSGGATGTNVWNANGTNAGTYSGANTPLALGTSTLDDLVFKVNSNVMGRLGVYNSISFGAGASAGQNGIALGTSSSSYQGISIGNNATVTANESIGLGESSNVSGYRSVALGYNAKVTVNESSAIGNNSTASGFQSIALGYNAKTNSNSETAIGYGSLTNGQNSTAIGSGASATGQNSTAIGYHAATSQYNAIVLGDNNANIGIGTSTPNTTAKLDVSGQYKLGDKGTVNKNQISFEVWPSVSINNIDAGKSATMSIAIPSALIPNSMKATIIVTPAGDFAGNSTFSISNPRMTSTSNIDINLTNIAGNAQSLYSSHFYVTINEF